VTLGESLLALLEREPDAFLVVDQAALPPAPPWRDELRPPGTATQGVARARGPRLTHAWWDEAPR
jgi:hypothetical protein